MFGKMDFAQAMRDIRGRANERCLSADATIHDTTRRQENVCTAARGRDRGKRAGANGQ